MGPGHPAAGTLRELGGTLAVGGAPRQGAAAPITVASRPSGAHPAWEGGSGAGGSGRLRGRGSPAGAHQDCAGSGPPSDPMLCAWAGGSGCGTGTGLGARGHGGGHGASTGLGGSGDRAGAAPTPGSLPAGAERYGVGTGARGGPGMRVTVPKGDTDTSHHPSHPRGPTRGPPPGRGWGPAGAAGCAAECVCVAGAGGACPCAPRRCPAACPPSRCAGRGAVVHPRARRDAPSSDACPACRGVPA